MGQNELSSVFNGEFGFVAPHALDGAKWKLQKRHTIESNAFRYVLRKEHLAYSYGSDLGYVTVGNREYICPMRSPKRILNLLTPFRCISPKVASLSVYTSCYQNKRQHCCRLELFYTGITRATKALYCPDRGRYYTTAEDTPSGKFPSCWYQLFTF